MYLNPTDCKSNEILYNTHTNECKTVNNEVTLNNIRVETDLICIIFIASPKKCKALGDTKLSSFMGT